MALGPSSCWDCKEAEDNTVKCGQSTGKGQVESHWPYSF